MSANVHVPLTVPIYSTGYVPTFRDHLTRGLLSGLFQGRSFVVLGGKDQDGDGRFQEERLSLVTTLLKIVCILCVIPMGVALYLNSRDQSGRKFTLQPSVTHLPAQVSVDLSRSTEEGKVVKSPLEVGTKVTKVTIVADWNDKQGEIRRLNEGWKQFLAILKMLCLQQIDMPNDKSGFQMREELFGPAKISFEELPLLYKGVCKILGI